MLPLVRVRSSLQIAHFFLILFKIKCSTIKVEKKNIYAHFCPFIGRILFIVVIIIIIIIIVCSGILLFSHFIYNFGAPRLINRLLIQVLNNCGAVTNWCH